MLGAFAAGIQGFIKGREDQRRIEAYQEDRDYQREQRGWTREDRGYQREQQGWTREDREWTLEERERAERQRAADQRWTTETRSRQREVWGQQDAEIQRRNDAEERARADQARLEGLFEQFGAGSGGPLGQVPDSPAGVLPYTQGGERRAAPPSPQRSGLLRGGAGDSELSGGQGEDGLDIAEGIDVTARSLGMPPEILATIISYETGGTFDPKKKGPTTQHGQHQGLIQFGEPQAKQYGVDWDRPLRSQLGPDGAVARYFRDRGWKPGMSMEDAYSIVNAGAPGLGHRTDENNGGAPGTVAEKVRNQMGGHYKKALALLGRGGNTTMMGGAADDDLSLPADNPIEPRSLAGDLRGVGEAAVAGAQGFNRRLSGRVDDLLNLSPGIYGAMRGPLESAAGYVAGRPVTLPPPVDMTGTGDAIGNAAMGIAGMGGAAPAQAAIPPQPTAPTAPQMQPPGAISAPAPPNMPAPPGSPQAALPQEPGRSVAVAPPPAAFRAYVEAGQGPVDDDFLAGAWERLSEPYRRRFLQMEGENPASLPLQRPQAAPRPSEPPRAPGVAPAAPAAPQAPQAMTPPAAPGAPAGIAPPQAPQAPQPAPVDQGVTASMRPRARPGSLAVPSETAAQADPRVTDSGTPAASVEVAEGVAERAGTGVNGARRPNRAERERGAKQFESHYDTSVVPKIVAFYMSRGRVQEAQAFQEFVKSEQVRVGKAHWSKAVMAAHLGDDREFVDQLAAAYNTDAYYDDGYTIEAKATKLLRDAAGNTMGARLTFRNDRTGETFTREFSGEDLYRQGIQQLSVENAFENNYAQLQAGRAASEEAQPSGKEVLDAIELLSDPLRPGSEEFNALPLAEKRRRAVALLTGTGLSDADSGDVPLYGER